MPVSMGALGAGTRRGAGAWAFVCGCALVLGVALAAMKLAAPLYPQSLGQAAAMHDADARNRIARWGAAQTPADGPRQRWHISLSTWLRDYLYVSLGGNRDGTVRTMVNLMITMLLGGLWHGAAWTFVIWGGFHGAWLAMHRLVAAARPPRTPAWLRLLVTFHLVLVAWVLFRAPSLEVVRGIVAGLFAGRRMNGPMPVGAVLLIAFGVLTHALAERLDPEVWWVRAPRFAQGAVVGLVIIIVGLFSAQSQRFIYFQF